MAPAVKVLDDIHGGAGRQCMGIHFLERGLARELGRGICALSRSADILANAWEHKQGGRIKRSLPREISHPHTGALNPYQPSCPLFVTLTCWKKIRT